MIIIEKLILFKAETSKADLINNTEDRIIAVLDDMALSAVINYNLDSNHTITVELDSDKAEVIINKIGFKQIIKAKTLEDDYEYFIITGLDKVLDDTISITAVHWLTEITSKLFCDDLKPRGLNANLMLKHIVEGSEEYKNNIQYAKDIETSGNIDTLVNCNLWQTSLGDYLEDLQELYGNCEVRKKGFTLSLMDYVGSRTPRYTVNYGENLISSTTSEEYILVKGILPKGYDGIRGNIVYSDKISSGITKVIEYPIRLREEGEEDEEGYTYYDTLEECQKALEDLAREEFETNKLDEIVITYDIEFLDLSTVADSNVTEKSYLSVGDVVNTKIDKYNTNINTRVVEMNYDVLAEEIEDVTLSNADIGSLKVPTLNSVSKEVENKPDVNEVISITKLESTNILNAGMKNSYVVVRKNEILVMDSPEIDNAVNVWRWNKNGLMHSNSGYNGIYTMGMRYDGVIFADLIKAGILKSLNDKTWINMEDGSFNFADALKLVDGKLVFSHTDGSEGITIDKGGIKVTTYSSTNGMEEVAKLIATSFSKNRDQNGLSICTTRYGDYLQVGYERENGAIRAAMFFVPVSIPSTAGLPYTDAGIYIKDKTFVENLINFKYGLYLKSNGTKDHVIYNDSSNNYLNIFGDNGINLGFFNGDTPTNRLILHEATPSGTGDLIESYGNWNFKGYTLHNLTLANYKLANTYANLETKSIAEVSALETNSTDNVRYVYKNITSKNNKIVLNIPSEYQGRNYDIVGVAKLGFGDYRISSKEENRFIIETDREMTMNIEISIN
ncbi:phage tail protein [Clostridium saudiense]|uniref:phage tail protein n=1 Tax=Clostridium saudiense TaxID=1414720 RepID=UPI0018A8BC09|nr:phage tail protein [Clostridium saudiense]